MHGVMDDGSSSEAWSAEDGQHLADVIGRLEARSGGVPGKVPPLKMQLAPLRAGPAVHAADARMHPHSGSELDDEESEGHDIIGDPKTARHGRQMDEPPMTARGYPGGGPDARRRGDDHDDDDLLHPERPINGVARELAGEYDDPHTRHLQVAAHHPGMRMGGSAPDLRRRRSEESWENRSGDGERPESMENGHDQDHGGDRDGAMRCMSYSWRETLANHPGLLERYPLAASASAERAACAEEQQQLEQQNGEEPGSVERVYAQWEGNQNEEYLNGRPSRSNSAAEAELQQPQLAETPAAASQGEAAEPVATPGQHHSQGIATPYASSSGVGGGGYAQPYDVVAGGHPYDTPIGGRQYDTPHSAPCPQGRGERRRPSSAVGRRPPRDPWAAYGPPWERPRAPGLEAAWSEVNEQQQRLAAREREVAQREAAVRRAEARNRATARQLAELRRRLDEYGHELEDGVAALTAQQRALREERWQAAELRARARRSCGGAGEAFASKVREWDGTRISWTPMST